MRNAWAKYVRQRWTVNTQAHVEQEWDLTPGRANGVVWGNITQNTIDHILDHPRGGLLVMLAVLAEKFGTDLAGLIAGVITEMRERLDHERARNEAEAGRLVALAARAAALCAPADRLRARLAAEPGRQQPADQGRQLSARLGGSDDERRRVSD